MWTSPLANGGPSCRTNNSRPCARLLNLLVKPRLLPLPEHFRLARGKVRLHRKIRARQVERVFVILAHGERATLRSIHSFTNQRNRDQRFVWPLRLALRNERKQEGEYVRTSFDAGLL